MTYVPLATVYITILTLQNNYILQLLQWDVYVYHGRQLYMLCLETDEFNGSMNAGAESMELATTAMVIPTRHCSQR